MNRLLIDNALNEKEYIKNISTDENILINDLKFDKYTFNINNSNVNIFIDLDTSKKVEYEINVNGGIVSFNNISFNSNDTKIVCNLNKKDSKILINNTVLSKLKLVKYDIKINHNNKKTNSDIYNNGVSKDSGSINFNVVSSVLKGNDSCTVNQDSKIISLNDNNINEINPVLLIDEYDCNASHSAFIGDFKGDKLFYLMSRGLSKKDALKLLLNGLLIGTLDICFEEKEMLKKKIINW